MDNVLYVHLLLSTMGHFSAANNLYCKNFPQVDPPSRTCVQVRTCWDSYASSGSSPVSDGFPCAQTSLAMRVHASAYRLLEPCAWLTSTPEL